MTRDEMLKISFRAYMEIGYQHPRMKEPILCLLIEIDFDEETMMLQPLFGSEYIQKDFYAAIQHCSIPKKRMQVKSVNGKTVNSKRELPVYEGSSNRINPNFKYENVDFTDAS